MFGISATHPTSRRPNGSRADAWAPFTRLETREDFVFAFGGGERWMMVQADVNSIRRLTDADVPSVTRIANQAIGRGESTWGPAPLTTAETTAMLLGLETRFESYVCVDGQGEVIGWAALRPHTNRPVYNVSGEVEVFVDSEWRRRGVGRMLIHHLLERAEALEYHALIALLQPVPTPPLAWAIRLGFRGVGMLTGAIPVDDEWRDLLVFEKFLPPRAEAPHAS